MPGVSLPRTFEDFAALESLAASGAYSPPPMAQPVRYEDVLRHAPVALDGNLREPTIVGKVPLWRNTLLRITGKPRGENPFGFAELLGRF